MALEPGEVTGVLYRLMSQIEAEAASLSVKLPVRRYITTGGAVYDCEQVSVSANSMTTGIAGSLSAPGNPGGCPPGWVVVVEMAIVRKASEMPEGRRGQEPPSVSMIESDTATADSDASILTQAIESIAGPGWDQYGQVPTSLQFGDTEGGMTAVVITSSLNMWLVPAVEES